MEVKTTLQLLKEQIDKFEPIVLRLDYVDFTLDACALRSILRQILYDDGNSVIAEIFDASRIAYGEWADNALRSVRVASKFTDNKQDEMTVQFTKSLGMLNKALTRIDLLMLDEEHYENWASLMGDCIDMLCDAYYDMKDAMDGISSMYDVNGNRKKYTVMDRLKEHLLLA